MQEFNRRVLDKKTLFQKLENNFRNRSSIEKATTIP